MSEPENFLSRWSRRKLDAEQEAAEPRPADQAANPPDPQAAASAVQETGLQKQPDKNDKQSNKDKKSDETFDLSTLPSLESITAETDIRLFLQKGVPAELARAALRRAWVVDPTIRDFIGIAENQWDFATGSDIPGFGSLDVGAEEIRRMVAEVFGEGLKPSAEAGAEPGADTPEAPQPRHSTASDQVAHSDDQEVIGGNQEQPAPPAGTQQDLVHRNKVDIAMQQSNSESEYKAMPTRRSHGRALPQ